MIRNPPTGLPCGDGKASPIGLETLAEIQFQPRSVQAGFGAGGFAMILTPSSLSHDPIAPRLDEAKAEARRLRVAFRAAGAPLSQAQALERVARHYGFRDWNTLSALARKAVAKAPVREGESVTGHYMGHPFQGRVLTVHGLSDGTFRVTLHFDEPIDVVRFDSFSALRHRVSGRIDGQGVSPAQLSDGTPHLAFAIA